MVVLFCSEKKKKKESVFLFYIYNFYFKNLIYKLIKKFQNLILSGIHGHMFEQKKKKNEESKQGKPLNSSIDYWYLFIRLRK